MKKERSSKPAKTPISLFHKVGLWVASVGATGLITLAVQGILPKMSLPIAGLLFGSVSIAIYFVWRWVSFERPVELSKKFPITSKELRREKKHFYDSFPH